MKRTVIALAAIVSLGLAGCETATPYQPLVAGNATSGGFTDQQLDATHFRVTFRGNSMTSREQVETYLLYRAAELTVAQGYDWFEMVARNTENRGGAWVTGYGGYWAPYWRFHGGFGWGAWDPFWGGPFWGGYDVQRIDEYDAIAEIAVGHGPRPEHDVRAFDARQVMANLGPKLVRPTPRTDRSP